MPTRDEIVEAAAKAIRHERISQPSIRWEHETEGFREINRTLARAALAALPPIVQRLAADPEGIAAAVERLQAATKGERPYPDPAALWMDQDTVRAWLTGEGATQCE